jgi:uncharacterized protein (UPF0332 family)
MTRPEAHDAMVARLMAAASESLESARAEAAAGWLRFAVNRVYYACFYGASAVLLKQGRQFVKHNGVRAALHRYLIKPGLASSELGGFYDDAFRDRQEADYGALADFDAADVASRIQQAERFVQRMRELTT